VVSTAEPYRLEFRSEYETPVLALSAATMRRLTRDPDQFLGIRMSGEDADCGLLSSFVGQAVSRMHRLREPMISRVEANILDLLGAVLTARETPGVVGAPQQRARIQAFIREHLRDRSLGPATIASAFGVSTRHVHALFEEEPMTVARLIRHERVHACRRALEAGPHDASLTDLALSWGFYDLSHMTRSFREEFGMTPRDVRAAAARLAYAPPSEDAAL
jgi:AraC-like DNA-binding protein